MGQRVVHKKQRKGERQNPQGGRSLCEAGAVYDVQHRACGWVKHSQQERATRRQSKRQPPKRPQILRPTKQRKCDREQGGRKEAKRFDDSKRTVVKTDGLETMPLLDEVDVAAEIHG